MIHKHISIKAGQEEAKLTTYFLDNYPEIDPERIRPAVLDLPRRGLSKDFGSGGGGRGDSDVRQGISRLCAALQRGPHSFSDCVDSTGKERGMAEGTQPRIPCGFTENCSMRFFRRRAFGGQSGGILEKNVFKPADWSKPGTNPAKPTAAMLSGNQSPGDYAHRGSFENLLGREATESMLREQSLECQVSRDVPPVFLWHTVTDETVPVENSMLFASALRKAQVSFELHLYPRGGHGLSLGTEETRSAGKERLEPAICSWIALAGEWLERW